MQDKSREDGKHGEKSRKSEKNNSVYYVAAVAIVVAALVFLPQLISMTGLSFLSTGSGLNKLFSFIGAAFAGWVCLLPSKSYKDFVALAKGARVEWRKTAKPDRDTVWRTTMMVLALVVMFAILVLLLDWVFGSVLRGFVN